LTAEESVNPRRFCSQYFHDMSSVRLEPPGKCRNEDSHLEPRVRRGEQ
jgi:hypothetical protein